MSIFDTLKNFIEANKPKTKKPVTPEQASLGVNGKMSIADFVNKKLNKKTDGLPADFFDLDKTKKIDVPKKLAEYGTSVMDKAQTKGGLWGFTRMIAQSFPRGVAALEKTSAQTLGLPGLSETKKGPFAQAILGKEPTQSFQEMSKGKTALGGGIAITGSLLDTAFPGIGGGGKKAVTEGAEVLIKSKALSRGEKIFEEFSSKIKEGPEIKTFKEKIKEVPGEFVRKIVSRFSPLSKYEKKIMGPEKPNISMSKKFEQVAGAAGKAEADLRQFENDIITPIKDKYDDFNTYLALKRSEDRLLTDAQLRKVGSYTLDDIKSGLAHMEQKLGPDVMNRFTETAAKYQETMDRMLRMQVDAGRISEKAYSAIKESNNFYAPFAVMKYIDEGGQILGGSNIATTEQIVKAIKGIEDEAFELKDILQTSAEKIYKANILAAKNKAMQALADLAAKDVKNEFFKEVPLGKAASKDKEIVTYFKNGIEKALEMPADVAKSIKGMNAKEADVLGKAMNTTYSIMRTGATSANLGFSIVNLITDSMSTALISKYGINGIKDGLMFPVQFVDSLLTAFAGNFKVGKGRLMNEYIDYLKSGAANSTVAQSLRPEAFKTTVGVKRSKNVLDNVSKFANAMEETGKILGLKRGKIFENLKDLNPAERAQALERIVTEVRNYGGSPDFAKRGDAANTLNMLVPFFNARLQGTARDLSRLFGKDGAKEAVKSWSRIGAAVGVPTAGLMAVNLSDENFDDYMQINTTERANYWMIPTGNYFTDSSGNKVRDYYRFPKRGVMKPFANLIEGALMFAKEKDPKAFAQMGSELASYISPINVEGKNPEEVIMSVASSANPLLKVPAEYGFNKNFFFKSDTVPRSLQQAEPREQYRASTPGVYKEIGKLLNISPLKLEQAVNGLTGGFTSQFTVGKPEEGRSPLTEFPVAKRFVRSSSISSEDFQSEIDKSLKNQTTKSVVTKRKAQELNEKLKSLPKAEANAIAKALQQTDPDIYEKLKDIVEEEKLGLTYKDKQIKMLNVTNGERARFIHSQAMKLKTREERNAYIKELREKKVISDTVFNQLKQLAAQEN